jgi:hypothetical protein
MALGLSSIEPLDMAYAHSHGHGLLRGELMRKKPFYEGGIFAMKFKRKIAGVLAAVMAFGSVMLVAPQIVEAVMLSGTPTLSVVPDEGSNTAVTVIQNLAPATALVFNVAPQHVIGSAGNGLHIATNVTIAAGTGMGAVQFVLTPDGLWTWPGTPITVTVNATYDFGGADIAVSIPVTIAPTPLSGGGAAPIEPPVLVAVPMTVVAGESAAFRIEPDASYDWTDMELYEDAPAWVSLSVQDLVGGRAGVLTVNAPESGTLPRDVTFGIVVTGPGGSTGRVEHTVTLTARPDGPTFTLSEDVINLGGGLVATGGHDFTGTSTNAGAGAIIQIRSRIGEGEWSSWAATTPARHGVTVVVSEDSANNYDITLTGTPAWGVTATVEYEVRIRENTAVVAWSPVRSFAINIQPAVSVEIPNPIIIPFGESIDPVNAVVTVFGDIQPANPAAFITMFGPTIPAAVVGLLNGITVGIGAVGDIEEVSSSGATSVWHVPITFSGAAADTPGVQRPSTFQLGGAGTGMATARTWSIMMQVTGSLADAEFEQIRRERPITWHPPQRVSSLIPDTNARWILYDRTLRLLGTYPTITGISPFILTAGHTGISNPLPQRPGGAHDVPWVTGIAPELVIPGFELNPSGGMLELTLTNWGGHPWRDAWEAGYAPHVTQLGGNAILRGQVPLNEDAMDLYGFTGGGLTGGVARHMGNIADLPFAEATGFYRHDGGTGVGVVWFYSGLFVGGLAETLVGGQHELPLAFRFDGTRLIIQYPPFAGMQHQAVLRLPLIALATRDTFTNVPELTIRGLQGTGGVDLPVRTLPYVADGAGVTISQAGGMRTGRNFVDLGNINFVSDAIGANAFVSRGQVVLELPLGYRWSHGSADRQIGLTGVATGGHVFIPSHMHSEDPAVSQPASRDGVSAPSIVVVTLPETISPALPATRHQFGISGLTILPAGTDGHVNFDYVDIMIQTGPNTVGSWTPVAVGTTPINAAFGWNGFPPGNFQGPAGTLRDNAREGNLRQAYRSPLSQELRVAQFMDFALEFTRHGAYNANQIPTIVGGWLPSADGRNERSVGRELLPGRPARRTDGNVASVRFRELVPNSGWTAHNLTFTLVDEFGNPHEHARIVNASFHPVVFGSVSGSANIQDGATPDQAASRMPERVWGNFYNRVGPGGQNWDQRIPTVREANTTPGARVNFSGDGKSVTVSGLRLSQQHWNSAMVGMEVDFGITADVNFEGPVYIKASNLGQAFNVGFGEIDVPPLHVANVRRGIYIETEQTVVQVGFQQLDVADIFIHEVEPGDFRSGTNIRVGLGEYGMGTVIGYSNVVFVPITTLRVNDHITIGGAARTVDRVIANLQPFHQAGTDVTVNIVQATRGAVPSYIHLHGLQVRTIRDVPFGTYELVIRGTSVLDNENFTLGVSPDRDMNVVRGAAGTTAVNTIIATLRPHEVNFRRYPLGPLMHEGYLQVATPGHGDIDFMFSVVEILGQESHYVAIDGIRSPMFNGAGEPITTLNRHDRLFVPLRFVTEAFGADLNFVPGVNPGDPATIEVTMAGRGGRTVRFEVGSQYYTVQGFAPMPMSVAPFIHGEFASTFIPVRYIGLAFGIDFGWDDPPGVAWIGGNGEHQRSFVWGVQGTQGTPGTN